MRLFSPDRQRLAGRPMYPAERPRYAIPELSVSCREHDVIGPAVNVAVMLCVGENNFRWFQSGPLPPVGLVGLIEDWLADPEAVMRGFGWTDPKIVVSPAATRVLDSLEIEL